MRATIANRRRRYQSLVEGVENDVSPLHHRVTERFRTNGDPIRCQDEPSSQSPNEPSTGCPSKQRTPSSGIANSRLRGPRLSVRAQDLCRAEPRPGRIEAHYPRPAWRAHRRAGAQTGGCRHRPHQEGREPGGGTAGARVHRGRSGTALPGDACGGELQRAHCGDLPRIARQPHPAGTGSDADHFGWPAGGGGAALRASRHPPRGQPGAHGAVQDVLVGRGLGAGSGWRQPLPFRAQVQGRHARAVPHTGRVPAVGPGVVFPRCRWPVIGARGGGIAVVDADRVPAQRDSDPAMGRCGPKGSRAAVARRQDGRTDGTADAHGDGGARGDRPRPAQPLGVRWGYTGQASVAALQLLAPRAGALRAGGCAHP